MDSDDEGNRRDYAKEEALNLDDGDAFNDSEDVDEAEDDEDAQPPAKKTAASGAKPGAVA